MMSKHTILLYLLVGLYTPLFASAAFLYHAPTVPEEFEIDHTDQTIYGKLNSSPHTFRFAVTQQMPFTMQVAMSPHEKTHDVSLILVREEERGVSEIGRSKGLKEQWSDTYDFLNAVVLLWSKPYHYTLAPGIYKLEVSSPENNRGYKLVLGEGDHSPLKELWYTRKVFPVDVLSILFTPFVFLPILLVFGVFFYRRRIINTHG